MVLLLRKGNSHSVGICRLIKKEDQAKKVIQTLFFSNLSSAYEFLKRRNIMYYIS